MGQQGGMRKPAYSRQLVCAVLFLFVVMMLDVDFARLREGFQRYLEAAPQAPDAGLIKSYLEESPA